MRKQTRKHHIEFMLAQSIARLVQRLSPRSTVHLGRFLGRVVYYMIPLRKSVGLANLRQAFPERSKPERNRILYRAYQHFGQTFIELMRTPIRSKQELEQRVIMRNPRVLEDALAQNKGAILMSGHFGNWEIMAAAITAKYTPMSVLAKSQHNAAVDKMINAFRNAADIETVHLGLAVRGVLKALRQGKAVALLADQNAKRDGIFVPFLGRPASTATGPALFALKTGAPVVFGACIMKKDGTYSVIYERLETQDIQGVSKEHIRILTERHVQTLERFIRRYPDHWFWMHKRWKTRPAGEKVTNQELKIGKS